MENSSRIKGRLGGSPELTWRNAHEEGLDCADPKRRLRVAFCVTTYNRLNYLKKMLGSFYTTRNTKDYDWKIYITDDGSTDGTIEYLRGLKDVKLILLNRVGVHEATNMLFENALADNIEFGFKTDDDYYFLKDGWDDLYINTAKNTGYDHLVYFSLEWADKKRLKEPEKYLREPIIKDYLQTYIRNSQLTQGTFFTFTPQLIEKVGWFDTKNFYKCYHGHVDFTLRACRAGFNSMGEYGPWDAIKSQEYIKLNLKKYVSAVKTVKYNDEWTGGKKQISEKIRISELNDRIYVERQSQKITPQNFNKNWTTIHTQYWQKWLSELKDAPNVYGLEIGVFEGRSSCWFCNNIITGELSNLTCVDPFESFRLDRKYKNRENRFDLNTVGLPIIKIRGYSDNVLPKLIKEDKKYHFIYLDGNHTEPQVKRDLKNCWNLLLSNGIIICDDYRMRGVNSAVKNFIKNNKRYIKKNEYSTRRRQIAIWKK